MYQNYIQQRANFNTQETRIESQIKRACGWPYKPGPSTKRKTIHRRAQRTQGARSFKKSYNDAWPINIYHQNASKQRHLLDCIFITTTSAEIILSWDEKKNGQNIEKN